MRAQGLPVAFVERASQDDSAWTQNRLDVAQYDASLVFRSLDFGLQSTLHSI